MKTCQKMDNLVSVITPSFNSEKHIKECVQSVLNQTYLNWELIIVDDFSSDASKDAITCLAEKNERIRPFFLKKNVGAAEARNIAIREAKGRYVAFLDSDDVWNEEKLEKQILFMKEKNIAFSFTAYQIMSEDGKSFFNIVEAPKNMTYSSYLKNTIIGCLTVVIDLDKTGRIEMPNIRVSEDMALWLQLLKRGFDAYALNEVLSSYRATSDSLSANKVNASKFVWQVYRKVEKLSFIYSLWCFIHYIFNALKKRIK